MRAQRLAAAFDAALVPAVAFLAAAVVFGAMMACLGTNPLDVYALMWIGGFGSAFSWHNTLIRASPLLLTALCAALPAQMGLAVIGGEGALVLGGLAAVETARACSGLPWLAVMAAMTLAACGTGACIVASAGALRAYRGVNETIGSLLITYLSIAVFNQLVEGPLRDPSDLNKPSTYPLPAKALIGSMPGTDVHWGFAIGVTACVAAFVLIHYTVPGFSLRIAGGNPKTARMMGLPVARMMVAVCALGGAIAGLAGMIETAAINGKANGSLVAGYGFTGILISFIARHNPLAIIPAALLLGGISASGGLIQRRLGLPDASVLVLQGTIFFFVLVGESLRGRDLFGILAAASTPVPGTASAEAAPNAVVPPEVRP